MNIVLLITFIEVCGPAISVTQPSVSASPSRPRRMVEAAIQGRTLFPVADAPLIERHAFAA
jgi:hypothetical protein